MSKLMATKALTTGPTLVLALETSNNSPHSSENVVACRFGKEIQISRKALESYYWRRLEAVEVDLLLLTGLVVVADRAVRRTSNWRRNLRLSLPVHNPELWNSEEVRFYLSDALWFLTGDHWEFEFRPRKERDDILNAQFTLRHTFHEQLSIMPYSGGLDSFAGLKQFGSGRAERRLLLIAALLRTALNALVRDTTRSSVSPVDLLPLPVKLPAVMHAEQSFRTRAFFFFSITALCARLAGAEQILIPENGQSSLGPSLVLWGNEPPFRGTHPGFTVRLTRFLQAIWEGRASQFNHVNAWLTKGQVLRAIYEEGDHALWSKTLSCGFDPRRVKSCRGGPLHCGICSNCLLRRLALSAGGFESFHESEDYFWKNLGAMSIHSSVDVKYRDLARPTTRQDVRMAEASIENHASLARIDANSKVLAREIHELSESMMISHNEAAERLAGLLDAHKREWNGFLSSLGPNSWVTRQAEVNS